MGEGQAVEFSLTAVDYAAYSQLVALRSWHKWLFRIGGIVFLLIAVSDAAQWFVGADGPDVVSVALFAAVGLFMLFFRRFTGWIARRRFNGKAFVKIREPMRIEISPEGLYSRGGLAETRTPWSSILDITVTPDAAYFFIMKNAAHVVPRHAFADPAAFDAFVAAGRGWWKPGGVAEMK